MAAGGRRWWGWHMTWRADHGEGVQVRKGWGGELPGGGEDATGVREHFTRAALAPAPTTQGHKGQEVVYAFREQMTLKAAEAVQRALDEGAASKANRTYHAHPHTGNTWYYAFFREEGMESIAPLPECDRQGNEVSTLARVAEEWVRETGGAEQVTWTVGAIRRARYRRGEWMTQEDTNLIFPVATRGPAAAQWRGQAVHIHLPDDRVLAHANCTPFFSPKHLDFVTKKNSFFCHLENTVFQTLPKNAFFISFAHFLLFFGGTIDHSLVQNQRVNRLFSQKKVLLANLKNTNFWIVWKNFEDGRCSHIRYMST